MEQKLKCECNKTTCQDIVCLGFGILSYIKRIFFCLFAFCCNRSFYMLKNFQCSALILKFQSNARRGLYRGMPLCSYTDICLCHSEADTGVKAEEDFKMPEDTEFSAEEDEQLRKKKGEESNFRTLLSGEYRRTGHGCHFWCDRGSELGSLSG